MLEKFCKIGSQLVDCKTVVIFANASDGEYFERKVWNEGKNDEGDWGETPVGSRASHARNTLRKNQKTTVLQSTQLEKPEEFGNAGCVDGLHFENGAFRNGVTIIL